MRAMTREMREESANDFAEILADVLEHRVAVAAHAIATEVTADGTAIVDTERVRAVLREAAGALESALAKHDEEAYVAASTRLAGAATLFIAARVSHARGTRPVAEA